MDNNINEVSIELSHDCSLECSFCSSSAKHPSPIECELSTEKIYDLMKRGKEIGAKYLSLSGGEPMIHQDIMDIMEKGVSMGFKILLYTCGNVLDEGGDIRPFTEEEVKEIATLFGKDAWGSKVIFDLQGYNSIDVDSLMMKDGAFDNICETIKLFNKYKHGYHIEGHFVPMKKNWHNIIPTMDFLESIGVETLSFLRSVPQGRCDESMLLNKGEFIELQKIFEKLIQDCEIGRREMEIRLGHPVDFRFLLYPWRPITACRGGFSAPLIQPDGNVTMCPGWKDLQEFVAGNVNDKTFDDIWENSSFYQEFRWFITDGWGEMNNECSNCPWVSECKGGCLAQRIYELKNTIPLKVYKDMSFKDILINAPKDPLCFR